MYMCVCVCVYIYVCMYVQQQLPSEFRFSGAWGGPNVGDLTPMCKLAHKETVSKKPTESIFETK